MDIVKALNAFRKSLVDDPVAFLILCILYKDGEASEAEIKETTGADWLSVKSTCRELYQSNYIRLRRQKFTLTTLAEIILPQFGVDKIILPFLIDELATTENAARARTIAAWAFDAEPERARLATRSLKNLRVFLSYNRRTSDDHAFRLILTSIVPAQSKLRSVLQNRDISQDLILYFSGHGAPHFTLVLDQYDEAIKASERTDYIMLSACQSALATQDLSEEFSSNLSFRILDYIRSRERDYMLETCMPRFLASNKKTIFRIVWEKLHGALTDGFAGDDFPKLDTETALLSYMESIVAGKTADRPALLRSALSASGRAIGSRSAGSAAAVEAFVSYLEYEGSSRGGAESGTKPRTMARNKRRKSAKSRPE